VASGSLWLQNNGAAPSPKMLLLIYYTNDEFAA
jgi:hypothetical protein